jgi:2-oxoglutarate dehydrogenase E2 component (dihydrolipoamide succinyltransferase)
VSDGRTEIRIPDDQPEGSRPVIATWLKGPGDAVRAHEPLAEIETDKVMIELASPVDGVVTELVRQAGDEVTPGELVAVVEAAAGIPFGDGERAQAAEPAPPAPADTPRQRLSPAVRRLLAEHGLDAALIAGSGADGRVTVRDVEDHLARAEPASGAARPAPASGDLPGGRRVPHDRMRLRIAEHMVRSLLHTAPHVTAVFEADMSAVLASRKQRRASIEAQGAELTVTAYLLAACARAVGEVPEVNSRWHEDALEIFDDVNIGVGTALGRAGLVVPVLRRVQTKDLETIATELTELTRRARAGQLRPEDLRGGTLTISNHGVGGSLFASPIVINQPQTAIVGVGKIEKRVVVRTVGGQDTIQIRPLCYVSLTIDHRALDAYQTNRFLSAFVATLEEWKD